MCYSAYNNVFRNSALITEGIWLYDTILKQNIQALHMKWCLVNSYRYFRRTASKNILHCIYPEDGDSKLLRRFGHNPAIDVTSLQKQRCNETSHVAVLKYFVHTILGGRGGRCLTIYITVENTCTSSFKDLHFGQGEFV